MSTVNFIHIPESRQKRSLSIKFIISKALMTNNVSYPSNVELVIWKCLYYIWSNLLEGFRNSTVSFHTCVNEVSRSTCALWGGGPLDVPQSCLTSVYKLSCCWEKSINLAKLVFTVKVLNILMQREEWNKEKAELTTFVTWLCGGGCREGRELLWDSRQGCWRRPMDAEEWGRRPDVDPAGYFIFLPRLCDLFSLRWYSMGDWRATKDRKSCHFT